MRLCFAQRQRSYQSCGYVQSQSIRVADVVMYTRVGSPGFDVEKLKNHYILFLMLYNMSFVNISEQYLLYTTLSLFFY